MKPLKFWSALALILLSTGESTGGWSVNLESNKLVSSSLCCVKRKGEGGDGGGRGKRKRGVAGGKEGKGEDHLLCSGLSLPSLPLRQNMEGLLCTVAKHPN